MPHIYVEVDSFESLASFPGVGECLPLLYVALLSFLAEDEITLSKGIYLYSAL
jgi:hypothetical protein